MFRCLDKLKNSRLSESSFHLINLPIQAASQIDPILDSGPCICLPGVREALLIQNLRKF